MHCLYRHTVADCQNVAIHIIESHENVAGETLIEPHYLAQHPPTTYLVHLDELHYVSTAAVTCSSDALENQHSTFLRSTEQDVLLNNQRRTVQKENATPTGKGLRPVKVDSCEKNQNTE